MIRFTNKEGIWKKHCRIYKEWWSLWKTLWTTSMLVSYHKIELANLHPVDRNDTENKTYIEIGLRDNMNEVKRIFIIRMDRQIVLKPKTQQCVMFATDSCRLFNDCAPNTTSTSPMHFNGSRNHGHWPSVNHVLYLSTTSLITRFTTQNTCRSSKQRNLQALYTPLIRTIKTLSQ